jgi:hypothetical protein
MAQANTAAKPEPTAKPAAPVASIVKPPAEREKAVIEQVTMSDGRTVGFAGKRKMLKEVVIDRKTGTVSIRFDFRTGETRSFTPSKDLLLDFAGHGASQKIGDETAGTEDVEDMVVAVDNIIDRLNKGDWSAERAAGDGFSGASVVIKAIAEVSKKTAEEVKTFLQKKLDDDKAKGGKLTRAALYASFRNPTSKTGQVIERLEREKKSKNNAVDADALLGELK